MAYAVSQKLTSRHESVESRFDYFWIADQTDSYCGKILEKKPRAALDWQQNPETSAGPAREPGSF